MKALRLVKLAGIAIGCLVVIGVSSFLFALLGRSDTTKGLAYDMNDDDLGVDVDEVT